LTASFPDYCFGSGYWSFKSVRSTLGYLILSPGLAFSTINVRYGVNSPLALPLIIPSATSIAPGQFSAGFLLIVRVLCLRSFRETDQGVFCTLFLLVLSWGSLQLTLELSSVVETSPEPTSSRTDCAPALWTACFSFMAEIFLRWFLPCVDRSPRVSFAVFFVTFVHPVLTTLPTSVAFQPGLAFPCDARFFVL